MNLFEKAFSIFAILFAAGLISSLLIYPELRSIERLLPLSAAGFLSNVGLIFIVLRDIFKREFNPPGSKYLWLAMILLLWPSVLYYLPRYGFHPR
jgi:hypothetical protein